MSKKILTILGIILILAGFLRFWQIGKVPASPDWDEVALGYNAYSILHTGRDEYGKFLPVVFRSFDDYKPGLYVYLTVPSVALLGLNVPAVRLPSILFGIATVAGVFFLLQELLRDYKHKDSVSLLTAFLIAISPWHIQFSRVGFEAIVGLAFNVLGTLFFVKAFKRKWMLFLAIPFLVGSMYLYQSDKVFAPLVGILLVIIYWKQIFTLPKKIIILGVIWTVVLALPLLGYTLLNRNSLERLQGVSIFSEQTQFLQLQEPKYYSAKASHDLVGSIIYNPKLIYTQEIIENYISHFSLNWLFISGDLERHHAPGMGNIYIWELPFILVGIYVLLFGKFDKKTKVLLFGWFLLAPVPAAPTYGVPHAIRALNIVPIFELFTALGVITAWDLGKRVSWMFRYVAVAIVVGIAILNISYYLDQYFVQLNYYDAQYWQYGYAKLVSMVSKLAPSYDRIIVSNVSPMDQSYMFFLFYMKYSPSEYQKQSSSGSFDQTHTFGKYIFEPLHWTGEKDKAKTLYVGAPSDFGGRGGDYTVNYPDGTPAMEIVKD